DRAVHRPVPQGSHRYPRRRPATHARGAPALPPGAGGAPVRGAGVDPGPGQAGRRAAGADPRRRLEGPAGGHLPAVQAEAADQGAKFADYFDFAEPFTRLPSHRVLAAFRGEKEEVLDLTLDPSDDGDAADFEIRIAQRFGVADRGRPADRWLLDTVRWAWRTRILVHLGIDLRMRLWQAAEDEAVRVFAANLRDLLLAAPAGTRPTMGLDPGFRTGVKVAVVDATGKVVATATIYP